MKKYTVLNAADNIGVAVAALSPGETIIAAAGLKAADAIPGSHKFSLRPIASGEKVIKYGIPIGVAVADIPAGAWVHVHNVRTGLSGEETYFYAPAPAGGKKISDSRAFMGYRRPHGRAGVRNEVWIVPTVGCVNWLAERLAARAGECLPAGIDAVAAFPHPLGCSQLGDDHEHTRVMLASMARHPNAGAVLYVGLGCENNTMKDFRTLVEGFPERCAHIEYMVAQEVGDELAEGWERLRVLLCAAATAEREPIPVSDLCVGMKCGASDGLSGVTANPLLGVFSDWLVDRGGAVVLTEVPEMFGAEKELLNRAESSAVFERGVAMINDFKKYFLRYGQPVYENPSPGNKDGGITTLEDKSIGCTQKGGNRAVVDIQPYGGRACRNGVTLLSAPGNDLVSISALAAAGAQLILFSTGRGNPLGGVAPVVKVSSNTDLARRKAHWIDFDAGPIASGLDKYELLDGFVDLILAVASGQRTRSEIAGIRDFAIFKDGVTL